MAVRQGWLCSPGAVSLSCSPLGFSWAKTRRDVPAQVVLEGLAHVRAVWFRRQGVLLWGRAGGGGLAVGCRRSPALRGTCAELCRCSAPASLRGRPSEGPSLGAILLPRWRSGAARPGTPREGRSAGCGPYPAASGCPQPSAWP